jgi:hypothetical protein
MSFIQRSGRAVRNAVFSPFTSVVSTVLKPPVMKDPLYNKSYRLLRKARVKCRASVGLPVGSPHSLN